MARPKKEGLEYFPLDVDFLDDDKILLLAATGGTDAVVVLMKLFCLIYKSDDGFFCTWDDSKANLLSVRMPTRIPASDIQHHVSACLSNGLFDEKLYEKYGILTSHGIQRRYILAVASRLRRRLARGLDVVFPAEYMLLTAQDILDLLGFDQDNPPKGSVCHESIRICHEQTPCSDVVCHESMPQRKEKERKGKERKEDERKTNGADVPSEEAPAAQSSSSPDLGWYGPKHTAQLSPKVYDRLCAQYGQAAVDDRIANMETWMRQSGKRYRDNAETLEGWLQRDSLPSGGVLPACSQSPPAYTGKKTGAHCFSQRTYSEEDMEGLYTDLDKLND